MPRLLLIACAALLTACGAEETSRPPAPIGASAPAVRWRGVSHRPGATVFTLQCVTPCRLRFRVEGADSIDHT